MLFFPHKSFLSSKALALILGIICHVSFLISIFVMWRALLGGVDIGLGHLPAPFSIVEDAVLILSFPLLHSLLLTSGGRNWLAQRLPSRLFSASESRTLVTTLFAITASLNLLAVFLLWTPSGLVLFELTGKWWWIGVFANSICWLLLVRALWDAGLSLQTGAIGWISVFRGIRPQFPPMPEQGVFKLCRQPIYLSFALILWIGPVMTLDKLALALIWTLYCITAPILKERRFARMFGEEFARYQQRVPYMVPSLRSIRAVFARELRG